MKNPDIYQSVIDAYSDCNDISSAERDLYFICDFPVTRDDAILIIKDAIPEGYNAFFYEILKALPKESLVFLAREGSVCIYVSYNGNSNALHKAAEKMCVDELDFDSKSNLYRMWWD